MIAIFLDNPCYVPLLNTFQTSFSPKVLLTQLCPTPCDPIDSSVHGILQAGGILEWVAIPFSGDLPDPGIEPKSPALQADSLPSEPPGKPFLNHRNDRFSVLFKYLFSLNAAEIKL